MTEPEQAAARPKYQRQIFAADGSGQSVWIDVYDVLDSFDVRCPGRQHAVKKLLCAGMRGSKGALQDLVECRSALERAIIRQRRLDGVPAEPAPAQPAETPKWIAVKDHRSNTLWRLEFVQQVFSNDNSIVGATQAEAEAAAVWLFDRVAITQALAIGDVLAKAADDALVEVETLTATVSRLQAEPAAAVSPETTNAEPMRAGVGSQPAEASVRASSIPGPAAAVEGTGELITHKGQTWKYTGETRKPRDGEHFATGFGSQVCIAAFNYETSEYRIVVKAEPATAPPAETGKLTWHAHQVRASDFGAWCLYLKYNATQAEAEAAEAKVNTTCCGELPEITLPVDGEFVTAELVSGEDPLPGLIQDSQEFWEAFKAFAAKCGVGDVINTMPARGILAVVESFVDKLRQSHESSAATIAPFQASKAVVPFVRQPIPAWARSIEVSEIEARFSSQPAESNPSETPNSSAVPSPIAAESDNPEDWTYKPVPGKPVPAAAESETMHADCQANGCLLKGYARVSDLPPRPAAAVGPETTNAEPMRAGVGSQPAEASVRASSIPGPAAAVEGTGERGLLCCVCGKHTCDQLQMTCDNCIKPEPAPAPPAEKLLTKLLALPVPFELKRGQTGTWSLVMHGRTLSLWTDLHELIDEVLDLEASDDPHWESCECVEDGTVIGYHVRWSEPGEGGKYLYVRHYFIGPDNSAGWCQNAAASNAADFNRTKRLPSEFHSWVPKPAEEAAAEAQRRNDAEGFEKVTESPLLNQPPDDSGDWEYSQKAREWVKKRESPTRRVGE